MTLKQSFSNDDGAHLIVDTDNMLTIDVANTTFANLPTAVATAVQNASLNTNNDWRRGTIQVGAVTRVYWFSLAQGSVAAIT